MKPARILIERAFSRFSLRKANTYIAIRAAEPILTP